MKHAVCPVIEWPLILIGITPLCLGGILSIDLTIPIVPFVHGFGCMWEICHPFVCNNSSLCCKCMIVRISYVYQCQKLSQCLSGNLSQMIKFCVNLKSATWQWSTIIPNTVIGNPSVVLNIVVVGWIEVLKLSSMSWYVEYLMSDIAAPESMRALQCFPAWSVIVGQSILSATVTGSCVVNPPCSWESLLGEGSFSLNDLSPLLSH